MADSLSVKLYDEVTRTVVSSSWSHSSPAPPPSIPIPPWTPHFSPSLFSLIPTHHPSPTSKHPDPALDPRLLAGLVQDVWDKFYKLKLSLLTRQRHETEALWMVQLGQWVERLGELGMESSDYET